MEEHVSTYVDLMKNAARRRHFQRLNEDLALFNAGKCRCGSTPRWTTSFVTNPRTSR